MRSDRLSSAIDERVISRDDERCNNHTHGVKRNNTNGDLARSHFHTLSISEGLRLCSGGSDDIHADIRENSTNKTSPILL